MRGPDKRSETLFSYVSCEARVPAGHPLRPIRAIVDEALEVLSPDFERRYATVGRPSIPPEKLLRALLLQAFILDHPLASLAVGGKGSQAQAMFEHEGGELGLVCEPGTRPLIERI